MSNKIHLIIRQPHPGRGTSDKSHSCMDRSTISIPTLFLHSFPLHTSYLNFRIDLVPYTPVRSKPLHTYQHKNSPDNARVLNAPKYKASCPECPHSATLGYIQEEARIWRTGTRPAPSLQGSHEGFRSKCSRSDIQFLGLKAPTIPTPLSFTRTTNN